MKRILSITMVLTILVCSAVPADSGSVVESKTATVSSADVSSSALAADVKRSMYAIKVFTGRLQGELVKAMRAGGPVKAIEVCNTRAGEIAAEVSAKQHFTMKRVSLKNRNPDNAANEWQRAVLKEFELRQQKGEPILDITYADIVETDTGKQFRFMKAIPAGRICMKCHGTKIEPAVQAELDKHYPDDKAHGYRVGDLRGAFVVIRDMAR